MIIGRGRVGVHVCKPQKAGRGTALEQVHRERLPRADIFRGLRPPRADCSATPRAGPPVMVSRMSTSHATAEWSGLGA